MAAERIIIIGAGPTGLGAGYRLAELNYDDWALYEAEAYVGGHAASFLDSQGFTWDEGGHVIFSHYPYFDRMIDQLLTHEVYERVRESWIVTAQAEIPYPFQNNLRYLPKDIQVECLLGAAQAWALRDGYPARNFREWILATFGTGIAEHFMFPYNLKVWTTPLEEMSKGWIAERVSVVDFPRLMANVIHGRDDVAWGPNSKFKFPLRGGTGEIYRRMASRFPSRLHLNKRLVEVDTQRQMLSFGDGSGDRYDTLISTIPLDQFVLLTKPADGLLLEASRKLRHNGLLVLGIGLKKKIETTRCWIYFPEPQMPCYRATFFSNYSPFNVPSGDVQQYSSLMCEMSIPCGEVVQPDVVLEETISKLIQLRILGEEDRQRIISRYHRFVPYSYPIPTLDRDEALAIIQPWLMQRNIFSRGRFGAWRYEIGNMDHSVMMGVEAVDNVLIGCEEKVFGTNA